MQNSTSRVKAALSPCLTPLRRGSTGRTALSRGTVSPRRPWAVSPVGPPGSENNPIIRPPHAGSNLTLPELYCGDAEFPGARVPAKSNGYFERLTQLLNRAGPGLAARHELDFKNCFGAVAGYVDGRIFISCGRFGVGLKLPAETLRGLFQESGVKPLKYFSKGHIKKDYAVLPKRILENRARFRKLVATSLRFVLSTSDQRPKKKRARSKERAR